MWGNTERGMHERLEQSRDSQQVHSFHSNGILLAHLYKKFLKRSANQKSFVTFFLTLFIFFLKMKMKEKVRRNVVHCKRYKFNCGEVEGSFSVLPGEIKYADKMGKFLVGCDTGIICLGEQDALMNMRYLLGHCSAFLRVQCVEKMIVLVSVVEKEAFTKTTFERLEKSLKVNHGAKFCVVPVFGTENVLQLGNSFEWYKGKTVMEAIQEVSTQVLQRKENPFLLCIS